MILYVGYLLAMSWAQVTGESVSSPSYTSQQSAINETTTALPRFNVSTTVKNGHTLSATTLMPTTNQHTTEATYNSGSNILSRLTLIATSATSPSSTVDGGKKVRDFLTTTAAPPFTGPQPSYRQFDALSFAGGALITISLVILGTYGWKMYIARIERSYWTL